MNQSEITIRASIICPVTNMAGRLQNFEKWIREISTRTDVEVIVVHDLGDKTTGEELIEICENLRNVQIIEGYFGNPGSARNAGLQICVGTWITFWDSDDKPNVQNFLQLLESKPESNSEVCIASYAKFNEVTKVLTNSSNWTNEFAKDIQTFSLNPGIWRIIFSGELLKGLNFKSLKMAEDQNFICDAVLKAKTLTFADYEIYTYYIGSQNHLTNNPEALQDLLPAFRNSKALIEDNGRVDISPLLNIMAARQLVSGFRYGLLKTRLGLLKSSLAHGFILRPSFLKALKTVSSSSVKGS